MAKWRVRRLALVVACLLVACGGPAPTATPGPSRPSSGPTNDASASGGPSVSPYDTATAIDAAQAEWDEVQRLRQVAGIAALIGPGGATVLKNVDDAKIANAEKTLPQVAKALGLDVSTATPGIASIRGSSAVPRARDDIEWTGSLLGQVSATTSMMMALLATAIAELASRSPDSRPGAFPDGEPETYPEKAHDGMTESVTISTRVRIAAAGGRVSMDVDISSVDTIKDQATGREIALLECDAHGHIDVNACPDPDGVSPGSYQLSLQEELVRPDGTRAGDVKVMTAPFSLTDGDDAALVSIEGTLSITEHAHGPGTAGTDPGGPFNWTVTATVPESIQSHGSATGGAPATVTDGDPSASQVQRTVGGRTTAEDYLVVVAKEAEKFWRSGQCIELTPSDDTRKVKPDEKIDLTVKAAGKYDGKEIAKPIVATFSGAASLDPVGRPVDEPAKFTFTAGEKKDEKGTIDLKQTSKRGIGKRHIEFTVDQLQLQAKIDATVHQDINNNVYDTAIHLKKLDLTPAKDGTSSATATVDWTTTYKPPTALCETKTYTGTFQTKVTARVDPADPNRVLVIASFIPGVLKPETLKCNGKSVPFTGGTSLGVWASIAATEHAVTIGGSLTLHPAVLGGTASVTVTITKRNP